MTLSVLLPSMPQAYFKLSTPHSCLMGKWRRVCRNSGPRSPVESKSPFFRNGTLRTVASGSVKLLRLLFSSSVFFAEHKQFAASIPSLCDCSRESLKTRIFFMSCGKFRVIQDEDHLPSSLQSTSDKNLGCLSKSVNAFHKSLELYLKNLTATDG